MYDEIIQIKAGVTLVVWNSLISFIKKPWLQSKIVKMDNFCQKWNLQFDKKTLYNIRLEVLHENKQSEMK